MTDSGSQSDETTSGTTSTGCGLDLEEAAEGSRYRRKREKRSATGGEKDHGSKVTGGGQRKKKGVLNAKERNMRRLESNERERKRMHDLNNQFQVSLFCFVWAWIMLIFLPKSATDTPGGYSAHQEGPSALKNRNPNTGQELHNRLDQCHSPDQERWGKGQTHSKVCGCSGGGSSSHILQIESSRRAIPEPLSELQLLLLVRLHLLSFRGQFHDRLLVHVFVA